MNEDDFHGQVAIVTGGASGVGLALAEALLAFGASEVAIVDRNDDLLERERRRLDEFHPGRVFGIVGDVTAEDDLVAAVAAVVGRRGRLDLLFNNAGAGFVGSFDELGDEDWRRAFALNFYGPLHGIRAVLPVMRRQRSGHIVNIVSGIAFTPMALQTMYAASKAALNAMSLALRYELWDEGIRVTSATPGTTATAIWGERGAPSHAQTAEQAARRILAGVARNERLVLGDDADASGATHAFDPAAASALDDYLLDVARRRRDGENAV